MTTVPETQEKLTWEQQRRILDFIAKEKGLWAGIPSPVPGTHLRVEKTFPGREILEAANLVNEEKSEDEKIKIRNVFWCMHWKSNIIVIEQEGRIFHRKLPGFHSLDKLINTLEASIAWDLSAETKAIELLADLLTDDQLRSYFLAGVFLEKSKKSGVTYMFRKLRPTVALAAGRKNEGMRIICTLCMHPIAYYADSWAGAMVPTDDVIAHLMLMRTDERKFWARSVQHAAYEPESGI